MPTGYTALLQENPNITFTEFAKRCARAMGACILQRDDHMDVPPKMDEPSRYHIEQLEEAQSRKVWLDQASDSELMDRQKAELAESHKYAAEGIEKEKATKASYERMLALVEAWEPPTSEHRGFKDFMLQQIRDSIKWDCDSTYLAEQAAKQPIPVAEYRAQQMAEVARDIAYHTDENRKEIERTNGRNEWKRQLLESLGEPVQA